jgi:hypothetical protein
MYVLPRPVTGIALLFYILDYVRTSQETHVWVSAACDGYMFTFLYIRLCSYLTRNTRVPPRPLT